MNTMYKNKPDGLCGNDDCGQLSAWYIFSTLGFYPVCPGSNRYDIGSPCVDEACIRFENGKKFTVKVESSGKKENVYIKSVTLNGKTWNHPWITHQDIINGGEMIFVMSNKPNKKWGVEK